MGSSADVPSCTGTSNLGSSFHTKSCEQQITKSFSAHEDGDDPALSLRLLSTDSPSNMKRVQFGSVEVIQLCMTMGDHPKCTKGPPVCVSADVLSRATFKINEFLSKKETHLGKSKTLKDLHLSVGDRRRIIRHDILHDKSWEGILMCSDEDADGPKTCRSFPSNNQIRSASKTFNHTKTSPSFVFPLIDSVIKNCQRSTESIVRLTSSSSRADALRNQTEVTPVLPLPHQSVRSSPLSPAVTTSPSRFRHAGLSVTERQAMIAEKIEALLVQVHLSDQKFDSLLARVLSLDTRAHKSRKLIEETMLSFSLSNKQSMGLDTKTKCTTPPKRLRLKKEGLSG